MSHFQLLSAGANRNINHTFSTIWVCSSRRIWREIFRLLIWLGQLWFRKSWVSGRVHGVDFTLLFLWQWRGNSLALNESGGGLVGTLAIHALVLPWRDGIRNPTLLPENVSRKLILIWGLGVERSLAGCFSFTFFKNEILLFCGAFEHLLRRH